MKSIKMDFVRDDDDAGVLQKGKTYHVVIESTQHRQFDMPFNQRDLLKSLTELRYDAAFDADKRKMALHELSTIVSEILEPPAAPSGELLQLDLVTNARELWALPFEAALAPGTELPLFAVREPGVVLTRRAPHRFVAHQPNWPARPRVLFAYASPDWVNGPHVEYAAHKDALLDVLQPWVEPLPGQPMLIGQETSVLTTLKNATLADIEQACRQAELEGKPYTHFHLLAHGIECKDPKYTFETWFGVALCADDKTPTKPEALVQALLPKSSDGHEMPIVVTLAICDGGNAANTIIESGGLAQELHRAGVPIVVASQLPLTFPGSKLMTRVFYEGWMAGKDVREVLHDLRVALYEAKDSGHDWLSLVAWVRLPEGYNDYLLDVRLKSQLAALETASKHANYLIEHNIKDGFEYERVTERLKRRIERLEELLVECKSLDRNRRRDVVQENAGLLGSAYKRMGELLANRAATDTDRSEHWFGESRSALDKARSIYRQGFGQNPAHHWTGVQYLALEVVLTGKISSIADWYACYVAATAQRDNPDTAVADRVWALGSIAELALISAVAKGVVVPQDGGAAIAVKDLYQQVNDASETFPNRFPIDSTRRQLLRYTNWWTKANGFFPTLESDLASEAATLIALLNDDK
jgi:hypothetical protein